MDKSYYDTLEVPETATSDEIKRAYRKMSLKYHPDKNIGKPEISDVFTKINEAFETLGNSDKKREYDMSRKNPFMRMNTMRGGGNFDGGNPFGNIDEMFSNIFFGGMGGPTAEMFQPGGNVHIFRNGVPVNLSRGLQKPTPIIIRIKINMEQVLTGATIPIEVDRWIVENDSKVFEKETVYVSIPKGIDTNEIILLREQGNIVNDVCKGDIKIFVDVENNTGIQRNGLDLIYEKRISLKEALCGFSFELKYINGKTYTINNQRGNIIPPEYLKMIPNMGLTRDKAIGNLIIHFKVDFPSSLTEEQMKVLSEVL
jgi:DnaJ-class molecular chaperone